LSKVGIFVVIEKLTMSLFCCTLFWLCEDDRAKDELSLLEELDLSTNARDEEALPAYCEDCAAFTRLLLFAATAL